VRSEELSREGGEVFRLESLPTGSFKVRGALNTVCRLMTRRSRGVITASSGNHGGGGYALS
jgi:threonine dehydratase